MCHFVELYKTTFSTFKMSNCEPTKYHLQEVILFLLNSKKSAGESNRTMFETYGEYALSIKICEYWFLSFKDSIHLTKNTLVNRKSLNMWNWKHYSTKIHVKHNKNWQNLWKLIAQQFPNVWMQSVTYELVRRDVERRFFMCEHKLMRKKGFFALCEHWQRKIITLNTSLP